MNEMDSPGFRSDQILVHDSTSLNVSEDSSSIDLCLHFYGYYICFPARGPERVLDETHVSSSALIGSESFYAELYHLFVSSHRLRC